MEACSDSSDYKHGARQFKEDHPPVPRTKIHPINSTPAAAIYGNATREAHEAARAVAAGTAADEPRGVDRVPEVTRHAGQPTGGLNFRPETSKKLGIEIETIPCPTQECYVMTP